LQNTKSYELIIWAGIYTSDTYALKRLSDGHGIFAAFLVSH